MLEWLKVDGIGLKVIQLHLQTEYALSGEFPEDPRQAVRSGWGFLSSMRRDAMKWKHLALGLGVLIVAGTAFLMNAYGRGEDTQEGSGVSASSPAVPLDGSTVSGSIGKSEMKQIRKLDFPECKDLDTDQGLQDCYGRLDKEASRVAEQRDPKLVPDLIKLAQQKKFKAPKKFKDEEARFEHKYQICPLRYAAIEALGEIKDPRALAPLLELMNESYTKAYGCPMASGDNDELITICRVAGQALIKLQPQGVTKKLLRNMENHKFTYNNTPIVGNYDEQNAMGADADIYECNVMVMAQLGDEGKKVIMDGLKSGTLSCSEEVHYLAAASYFQPNAEDIEVLKKYLVIEETNGDSLTSMLKMGMSYAAADALTSHPMPENIELYKYLIEIGFESKGFETLGKLKEPSVLPYLVEMITGNNSENAEMAADALSNYDAESIRPVLPTLLKNVKEEKCGPCYGHLGAIVKADDVSAIKDLMGVIYSADFNAPEVVGAIGKIGGPEARSALKEIAEDEDFIQELSDRKCKLKKDELDKKDCYNTASFTFRDCQLTAESWLKEHGGDQ